jgi:hypothetical protein
MRIKISGVLAGCVTGTAVEVEVVVGVALSPLAVPTLPVVLQAANSAVSDVMNTVLKKNFLACFQHICMLISHFTILQESVA